MALGSAGDPDLGRLWLKQPLQPETLEIEARQDLEPRKGQKLIGPTSGYLQPYGV